MIFKEWVQKHGLESAKRWFYLDKHLVFVIYPKSHVMGVCGNWHGSEPLANKKRNPNVETAKQRIRDALCNCFETEETIINTP